jgi:hypothetical protein
MYDTALTTGFFPLTLIGVGGLGTALLPALYRLKPKRLTLWDDDIITPENLVNQLFWKSEHVGLPKVIVAAEMLRENGLRPTTSQSRYVAEELFDDVVIAAVDLMDSRRAIWNGVKASQKSHSPVKLLLDGRLSRESPFFLQLFSIDTTNPDAYAAYENWLTDDDTSDSGRRDPDMISAPLVLSGFMTMLLIQWSRGGRLPWQTVWSGVDMSLTSFYST